MKTIHLIRCSVGALSIFSLVACESNQSRNYRAGDRDATGYPRNSDGTSNRNTSGSSNRYRSDANWNNSDNRFGTTTSRDTRTQSTNQPEYGGTMDRVDTTSPAWQGRTNSNAGTGYTGAQQPNAQSPTNTQGTTQQQQNAWNNQQPSASQQSSTQQGNNWSSQNTPTNSNAGTGYTGAQQPNAQSPTNTQGTTQQQQNAWNNPAQNQQINTWSQNPPSNSNAGTGYTDAQQRDAARNSQNSANTTQQPGQWNNQNQNNTTGNYSNSQQPSNQQVYPFGANPQPGQSSGSTPSNPNDGTGYSSSQMNSQQQTDNRTNQYGNTSNNYHPTDRNSTYDNTDRRYDNRNESYRNDSNRDTSYRSDSYRDNTTSRTNDNWDRYGPDNRHDGGGYSAALISPERRRGYDPAWGRPMPRDSGAGTGYPMSWQRAAFRDRREYSGRYDNNDTTRRQRWDDRDQTWRNDTNDRSDTARNSDWNRNDRDDRTNRTDRPQNR